MASNNNFKNLAAEFEREISKVTNKYEALKDLDLFILDNSIRESTVGQLRGHTLESKWELYNEVKKCGFSNMVVAAFSHMTRVDDVFVKQLVEKGEDRRGLYGFSEVTNSITRQVPDVETIPVGLRKMKETGLWNVIFEVDLGDPTYDFGKFSMEDMCQLVKKWIVWTHDNMYEESKVFVNLRDPPDFMPKHSERCFQLVSFLASLPKRLRPEGILFEEPGGKSLPEECGAWSKFIRKVMDAHKWKGHLLVHVHQKFDLCEASVLESLMNGANGLWSSVCIEGAAMGNASSCVTILNLLRLGNKKVLKKYNCSYLRKAAINVTILTTGVPPHDKQPIYGPRALDFVYDVNQDEFDLAEFFDEEAPIRITTMATPEMILMSLEKQFGKDEQFTLKIAEKMKQCMLDDLKANRKEEYMSAAGLAILFDRAGGSLTEAIRDVIDKDEVSGPHARHLIAQIREIWDVWDLKDEVQGDEQLDYDSFYNGFMAPFFACYRCLDTKKALQALDMDADNQVDWSEFMVYLKWALRQNPDIKDKDELLEVAFRKGIIPAMRDELVKQAKQPNSPRFRNEIIHIETSHCKL